MTTDEIKDLFLYNTTPYDSDSTKLLVNFEAKTCLLSGSSWRDISGNGNHGTITGAIIASGAPSILRKQEGYVKYENFDVRPYTVAALNTSSQYMDGTAGGTTDSKNPFKLYAGNSGTWEVKHDEAEGGALKLSLLGTGSYIQMRSDGATAYTTPPGTGFVMKANTQYKLSFKMKTRYVSGDSASGATVLLLEASGDGTNLGSDASFSAVKTTTDWTEYSVTFTSKPTTVRAHIEYRIYGHTGTGTLIIDAWFKDIRLEEV